MFHFDTLDDNGSVICESAEANFLGIESLGNPFRKASLVQCPRTFRIVYLASRQWLSSPIENLEIFVVRVNAAVIAPGGFGFGQLFEGRGHGRHVETPFPVGSGVDLMDGVHSGFSPLKHLEVRTF